jgi:hypothetical protein
MAGFPSTQDKRLSRAENLPAVSEKKRNDFILAEYDRMREQGTALTIQERIIMPRWQLKLDSRGLL